MIALLIIVLLALFAVGVPVAISIALGAAAVGWFGDLFSLTVIPQLIFNSINSFPLMAIPFFILSGYLMQEGGISDRLVNLSSALVGHISGGLTMVAVLTSLFFAAISGSGAATTAAVGSILIPAMIAKGYNPAYASANQAVSGELGVIIPPSIPLILYAISANTSVGDMFLAGVLPGLLIVLSLMIAAYIVGKRNGYKGEERATLKELLVAFKGAILALMMPIIILGGIYGGFFTPTEAAVVAVAYAFIIGVFVYRKITMKSLVRIGKESAVMTAVIMLIIGAAGLLSFVLNRLQIPTLVSDFFLSITTSHIVFILMVTIMLLVIGMFIENAAAILIFVPILLPVAVEFGIDPVHFGIIMVVNLAIGMFTPPVGVNLFVVLRISKLGIGKVTKALLPFIVIMIIDLLIISFVPQLSLFFLK